MLNGSTQNFTNDVFSRYIIEIIVFILIAITGFIWLFCKRQIKDLWNKWYYYQREIKKNIRELRKDVKSRRHPAAGVLMTIIAHTSAAHLFKRNGEELTLDEYGDILTASLNKNLKECVFIARTKPSDWYAPGDLGVRIRKYFNKQCKLKNDLGENINIARYIILPEKTWDDDDKKNDLINDYDRSNIELYFCNKDNLSSTFSCDDKAIFIDKKEGKWAIESLDFDEHTIEKYLKSDIPLHIKVMIEDDQAVLNNWYSHMLATLKAHSIKLAPKEK